MESFRLTCDFLSIFHPTTLPFFFQFWKYSELLFAESREFFHPALF